MDLSPSTRDIACQSSSLGKPSLSNASENLPQRIIERANEFRLGFQKANKDFVGEYDAQATDSILRLDQKDIITSEDFPTLLVAREAFGMLQVKIVLRSHLYNLCKAQGITSTTDGIDAIISDIMHGYSDLRITEIIYAFKLIRESRFREGNNQERDACQFYGTLSSQVICNCLHRYRYEYRNPVIDAKEKADREKEQSDHDAKVPSAVERDLYILSLCLRDLFINPIFSNIFSPKRMEEIQHYVEERKCNNLLRKRVKEFIEGKIEKAALQKAVDYLDSNFPISEDANYRFNS